MHLKRKHCIKHLIQVPVHILCVWIHQAGIRCKTDSSTLPYRVLFFLWPQKYGLYSCSYPLITSQLSWITKGTRWVILADSVTNASLLSKTSTPGNQPIINPLPHRRQRALFSQKPWDYKQNYFGLTHFKAFFKFRTSKWLWQLGDTDPLRSA